MKYRNAQVVTQIVYGVESKLIANNESVFPTNILGEGHPSVIQANLLALTLAEGI